MIYIPKFPHSLKLLVHKIQYRDEKRIKIKYSLFDYSGNCAEMYKNATVNPDFFEKFSILEEIALSDSEDLIKLDCEKEEYELEVL